MSFVKVPNVIITSVGVLLVGLLAGGGCTLFESEEVAQGRELFMHYCVHCHGPSGRGDGYNASRMDPRPRDLTDSQEEFLGTLSDQEVFEVISRDMTSYEEFEEEFGEEEDFDFMLFVPPNMPTFKYTLSDMERWALVAFVRTLHGQKAEVDLVAMQEERESKVREAQAKVDAADNILTAAEEAAEARGEEEAEFIEEEEAVEEAELELAEAEAALVHFKTRRRENVPRPTLATKPAELEPLIEQGKTLYLEKYGCDSCHALNGVGGIVGPELDRAGFRLNGTWAYRWIKSPQAMKRKTRMPNLGLTDEHARAVTAYLGTLQAPPPSRSAVATAQQSALQ